MKDCGSCYYRNSTWSQQHREMSAQCDHQNAPEDALLVLRVGANSHVNAPDWCPLTKSGFDHHRKLAHQNFQESDLIVTEQTVSYPESCEVSEPVFVGEMLHSGLFRFVAGNVSIAPTGELIVTDGRFVHVPARDFIETQLRVNEARREEVIRDLRNTQGQLENVLDTSEEGAWMARALDAERHRDVLKDQLKYAESYMERQLLAVKQECSELKRLLAHAESLRLKSPL
jgi:hypothetical protein